MKIATFVLAATLIGGAFRSVRAQGCEFVELAEPLEMDLSDIESLMFVGAVPTVVSRQIGDPKMRILRHTNSPPELMTVGRQLMVATSNCVRLLPQTESPTAAAPSSSYLTSVASFLSLTAGSYLSGASPPCRPGLGFWLPLGDSCKVQM